MASSPRNEIRRGGVRVSPEEGQRRLAAAGFGGPSRAPSRGGGYSPSPHRSPEYLEAARSTDALVGAKVRGFNRQAHNVQAELRRALPRLNTEGLDRREAINDDFESRGLFASGANLVARAKSDRDVMFDYTDLTQRATEQIQSLMAQAAEARMAGRSDVANAALRAAGDLRSRASEQAIRDMNQRNVALQAQLRQLLGQYGSY